MTEEEFAQRVEDMQRDGFAILPDVLTQAECDEAQAGLDRLVPERGRGGTECLFNKAQIFERLYQVPDFLRFIRHFLGPDALLSSMHGSIFRPGEGGRALHADGAITGHNRDASMAPADANTRITSHVIALNTITCISEFTAVNGATELVPGSHLHPTLDRPPDADERAATAVAARGSTIVFNANTWHSPTENRSDVPRYAILNPWRRHWTRCEYEVARIVDPEVLARAGEEGRKIFGLDAQPPYVEMWQWNRDRGEPKEEWGHLRRD